MAAGKTRDIELRLLSAETVGLKQLFDAVGAARSTASSGTMFRMVEWLRNSKRPEIFLPTTWRITRNLYAAPPYPSVGLIGELEWASVVLHDAKAPLKAWVKFKGELQSDVLAGRWKEALRRLDDFEASNGSSFACERLRIATIQQESGTGAQITYSRRLEARSNAGVFRSLIQITSVRNEEHVSVQSFTRQISELLKNGSDLTEGDIAHVIWHAHQILPPTTELLAEVVRRDCTSSAFDLFECIVAVCAEIALRSELGNYRNVAKTALLRIGEVGDRRVSNTLTALGLSPSRVGHPVRGDYPMSPTQLLRVPETPAPGTPLQSFYDDLALLLGSDEVPTDARFPSQKIARNFRPLPVAEIVAGVFEQYGGGIDRDRAICAAVALNADHFGPWHALALPDDLRTRQLERFARQQFLSRSSARLAELALLDSTAAESALAEEPHLLVDFVLKASKRSSIDPALLPSIASRVSAGDWARALSALCGSYQLPTRAEEYLFAASDLAISRPALFRATTPRQRLEQIRPVLLSTPGAVLFCVCASTLLQENESDKLQDKLLVAVETVVKSTERFLSALREPSVQAMPRLHWFIQHVLIPSNMALIDGVASLRSALGFRTALLRYLMEADASNAKVYESELKDISFDLVVDEGMRHVDQSRLYVNLEGLKRWAEAEVREEIERYREVAKLDVTEVLGDHPLVEASDTSSLLAQLELLPRKSTDEILVRALFKLKSAYLTHPRFGLDGFISLRVRHGTLAGTLRSAFDERNLLLLRSSGSGSFLPPTSWLELLEIEGNQSDLLVSAFEQFTFEFQGKIDDLVQKKVRIRGPKFPEGMIDIDLTEVFFKGIKIDIAQETSFDDLLEVVFLAYKNSASVHLSKLRDYLASDFTRYVSHAAEVLRSRCSAVTTPELGSRLSDAITAALTAFRATVTQVSSWLEVAHKDDLSQIFSLEQIVQISIDYTKRVRSGFEPQVSLHLDGSEMPLAGRSLVILVHALFIMLDNVWQHAGRPNERAIQLHVRMRDRYIELEVTNDLAPSTDKARIREALRHAESDMSTAVERGLHLSEGHSGFPKLKQLASASDQDGLRFYESDGLVTVRLRVPYSTVEGRLPE